MPSSDTAPPKATSVRSEFQAVSPAATARPARVRKASRPRRAFGQKATTMSRTTAALASLGGDLGDLPRGRLDALQQRPREDAERDDRGQQRHHDGPLAPVEVANGAVLLGGYRALPHALVGPEQVDRAEDHAQGAQHGVGPVGEEGAEEGEELADE